MAPAPRISRTMLDMATSEINQYKDFARTGVENVLTQALGEVLLGTDPETGDELMSVEGMQAMRDLAIESIHEAASTVAPDVVAFSADYLEMLTGKKFAVNYAQVSLAATPRVGEIEAKVRAMAGDVFSGKITPQQFVSKCVSYSDRMVNETHTRSMDRMVRRKTRWARVTDGRETCKFCIMLSSRGPVYLSAAAAGAHTHGFCDCRIVPGQLGKDGKYHANVAGYDPDALYDKWVTEMRDEALRKTKPLTKKRQSEVDRYIGSYYVANPRDAITKLIPDDLLMRKSKDSKIIYESNASDYKVILDFRNGYFTVINKTLGKFRPYVTPDGSALPKGMPEDEYRRKTHFRIEGFNG